MALVLVANLKLGASTGVEETDEGTGVDMTSEVTDFKITGTVNTVVVPATGSTIEHGRGGAADYSVTIGYLSNDITGSLFSALWAALSSATHALFFSGTMRGGAPSATNPEWTGILIVTEAIIGGAMKGLSVGSATFPLTGAPTKSST
jgi:hypothetical protein